MNKIFSITKEGNSLVVLILGIRCKFNLARKFNNKILYNNKQVKLGKNHIYGLKIKINGSNNVVRIKRSDFRRCNLRINASNAEIEIGENCNLVDLDISVGFGNNQKLKIGNGVTCFKTAVFLSEENACFEIGDECMLSGNITVWATDGHAIIDKVTQSVTNKPHFTKIGRRCWIGYGVHLCKNANLADNCIVGAQSVVTRKFEEENIIIAGNPAKIVRHNVEWERATPTVVANQKLEMIDNKYL